MNRQKKKNPFQVRMIVLAAVGAFVSLPAWAASYVQALGKVVAVDSDSVVIESLRKDRPIQFVLKNTDRGTSQNALKKGDRVRIWYSLELKRVDRIDRRGETRILAPPEGFAPAAGEIDEIDEKSQEKRLHLDDRAFFGA